MVTRSRTGLIWHRIGFLSMSKTWTSTDGTTSCMIWVTLLANGLKTMTILKKILFKSSILLLGEGATKQWFKLSQATISPSTSYMIVMPCLQSYTKAIQQSLLWMLYCTAPHNDCMSLHTQMQEERLMGLSTSAQERKPPCFTKCNAKASGNASLVCILSRNAL